MTEQQALKYIHSLNRFGIKPGLERITALLDRLGDPQNELSVIHIAGTNGKGSTATAINNIMQAAGKKTGLFISPYVLDFKERIQVNNEYITSFALGELTERVAKAAKEVGEELMDAVTEFEFITAVAFLYFKQTACDIVVLETGLGGRLDSTNVIKSPLATVITKIALDHTAVLGDTITEIAKEKCGIIKKGSPVITHCSQPGDALLEVAKTAEQKNADAYIVSQNDITDLNVYEFGSTFKYKGVDIEVNMPGNHQVENMSLAAQTALALDIPKFAIKTGIQKTIFSARLEVINKKPLVLLDGAHNPNGAEALSRYLDEFNIKPVAVIGMMRDKNCQEVIKMLASRCQSVITVEVKGNDRAATNDELCVLAKKYCKDCCMAEDYLLALNLARQKSIEINSPVLICGSLYLASDIRDLAIKTLKN